MMMLRHILGLAIAAALFVGAFWLFDGFAELTSQPALRPWRADLLTWRIPILAAGGFLLLSFLHWLGSKLPQPPDGEDH